MTSDSGAAQAKQRDIGRDIARHGTGERSKIRLKTAAFYETCSGHLRDIIILGTVQTQTPPLRVSVCPPCLRLVFLLPPPPRGNTFNTQTGTTENNDHY